MGKLMWAGSGYISGGVGYVVSDAVPPISGGTAVRDG